MDTGSQNTSSPTNNTPPPTVPKSPSWWSKHLRKAWGYYLLLFALVVSNLYWTVNRNSISSKLHKEIEGSRSDIAAQSKVQLIQSAEKKLKLLMQPFAWAVRSSVLRQNKDEIDQYFLELVRNPDVVEAFLVDAETKEVFVATNKKHEKMKFADLYDAAYLSKNEISFEVKNNQYFLSAPVMSLDKRLGTLFLVMESDDFKDAATPASDTLKK